MYFNISIDIAKLDMAAGIDEDLGWRIACRLEMLARRLRNTGTATISTEPRPSEITGNPIPSFNGKITDDGTPGGDEIGEFSLDETPALGDKLRATPWPPPTEEGRRAARLDIITKYRELDQLKAAPKPAHEQTLTDEDKADPDMHKSPHQCWDGCGACDACGRWIGDPTLEDTKPIAKVEP